MLAQSDLIALMAAVLLANDPATPTEATRVRSERRALRSARRIVARARGVRASDLADTVDAGDDE